MTSHPAEAESVDRCLQWLGLDQNPFSMAPDVVNFYSSARVETILVEVLQLIETRMGFALLYGDVGLGKTTICRRILYELDQRGVETALVFNTSLQGVELLREINRDFGVSAPDLTLYGQMSALNAFLLEQRSAGRNCVIIIDDAQGLTVESLELVRQISNMETGVDKIVQIILIGQPELEETLNGYNLRQLKSRIVLKREFRPYTPQETATYIRSKIARSGDRVKLEVTDKAVSRVHEASRGTPRRINVIMGRCLYAAVANNTHVITQDVADAAIRDIEESLEESQPAPRRRRAAAIAAGLAVMLPAAFLASSYYGGGMPNMSLSSIQQLLGAAPVYRTVAEVEEAAERVGAGSFATERSLPEIQEATVVPVSEAAMLAEVQEVAGTVSEAGTVPGDRAAVESVNDSYTVVEAQGAAETVEESETVADVQGAAGPVAEVDAVAETRADTGSAAEARTTADNRGAAGSVEDAGVVAEQTDPVTGSREPASPAAGPDTPNERQQATEPVVEPDTLADADEGAGGDDTPDGGEPVVVAAASEAASRRAPGGAADEPSDSGEVTTAGQKATGDRVDSKPAGGETMASNDDQAASGGVEEGVPAAEPAPAPEVEPSLAAVPDPTLVPAPGVDAAIWGFLDAYDLTEYAQAFETAVRNRRFRGISEEIHENTGLHLVVLPAVVADVKDHYTTLQIPAPEIDSTNFLLFWDPEEWPEENFSVFYNKPAVERLQKALSRFGAYHYFIDGLAGPRTIAALELFQRAVGLPETGKPDVETLFMMEFLDPQRRESASQSRRVKTSIDREWTELQQDFSQQPQ